MKINLKQFICLLILISISSLFYFNKLISINDYNSIIRSIRLTINDLLIRRQTIFCIILTHPKHFDNRAKLMYEIWANKCDNYKFISTIPTSNISKRNENLIEIDYNNSFTILQPPGLNETLDSYNKLTDKVLLSYKYIYNEYGYFDWYLKADDDTLIIMDNLRKFVSNKDSSRPVTYGYKFKLHIESGYLSGGAGYLMSREAFHRLGNVLNKNMSYCPYFKEEDIAISNCFRLLEVIKENSTDEFGRERYIFYYYYKLILISLINYLYLVFIHLILNHTILELLALLLIIIPQI